MTETRLSVYSCCRQCQRVLLHLKVLNSSAERQLCDDEFHFQTEEALTLKALANNESAILGTDSNCIPADRSVHSGW